MNDRLRSIYPLFDDALVSLEKASDSLERLSDFLQALPAPDAAEEAAADAEASLTFRTCLELLKRDVGGAGWAISVGISAIEGLVPGGPRS